MLLLIVEVLMTVLKVVTETMVLEGLAVEGGGGYMGVESKWCLRWWYWRWW